MKVSDAGFTRSSSSSGGSLRYRHRCGWRAVLAPPAKTAWHCLNPISELTWSPALHSSCSRNHTSLSANSLASPESI